MKPAMKTYHLINARYLGPTNTKGSRVRLTSLRFGRGKSFPLRGNLDGLIENAEHALRGLGYTIVGVGETSEGYIFAVEEFCLEIFAPAEKAHDHAGSWQCGRRAPGPASRGQGGRR